jgi:transcriptional regulator with PAS, ATPase and Fis domain
MTAVQQLLFTRSLGAQIERLSRHDCPIIVTGETGSGKEMVVREIHRRSARSPQPIMALNCAAIPAGLVETELFGHRRGAFTGAVADAPGLICLADKGTLFLDEIGDLDPQGQAKLLRVVETKEVVPVGAGRGRLCDVRFVAATHRDLDLESGAPLREDLFYRLCVGHVHVPPLRGRHGHIRQLLALFVHEQNRRHRRQVKGFDPEAEELLVNHRWPGNIRELKNLVEATFVNADGPLFHIGDIPECHNRRLTGSSDPVRSDLAHLLATLKACNGNKALAARRLHCSRATLYRRLGETVGRH